MRAEPPLLEMLSRDGGWQHERAADYLKSVSLHESLIAEPARRAHADHGPGEIWGVRADESVKGTGRWSLYHSNLALEIERNCRTCCATKAEQRRAHGGLISRADRTRVIGPAWDWKPRRCLGLRGSTQAAGQPDLRQTTWSRRLRRKLAGQPSHRRALPRTRPGHVATTRMADIVRGNRRCTSPYPRVRLTPKCEAGVSRRS